MTPTKIAEAIEAAIDCCGYYRDELSHLKESDCSVSQFAGRMTYAHLKTLIEAASEVEKLKEELRIQDEADD